MTNPLFQMFGGGQMGGILQRFQQFKQTFQGDPRQQVQNLLNSGKITQTQYNQAVQMATQFQKMFGK